MYQPYQNFNQNNPYQQANMNQMMMKQNLEQMQFQNLKMTLKSIFQFQNQPELHNLIQLIQGQQKNISAELQGCIKTGQIKKMDETQSANLRDRCKKIKERNQKILVDVLNLREKLTRVMYASIDKNVSRETQTIQLQQKIRKIKSQITAKFHTLKSSKNQIRQKSINTIKNNMNPVKTVMTELKSGTQMLQKQVVRTREQMNLVVNYLQGN